MTCSVIDLKLIDAWTVLCLAKDDGKKTIEDIIVEVNVPEKYREEVSIRMANRRIEVLGEKEA